MAVNIIKSYNNIYKKINLIYMSEPQEEPESKNYSGYTFYLENFFIRFRRAIKTPKKIGFFVTLWHKNKNKIIQPYDRNSCDYVIVCVKTNNKFGQFIFPADMLAEKNILATNKKGGKLAFRLYPPWIKPTSKQAIRTRKWQVEYFIDMTDVYDIDLGKAKQLFS